MEFLKKSQTARLKSQLGYLTFTGGREIPAACKHTGLICLRNGLISRYRLVPTVTRP
jgi:hypothetical protein